MNCYKYKLLTLGLNSLQTIQKPHEYDKVKESPEKPWFFNGKNLSPVNLNNWR